MKTIFQKELEKQTKKKEEFERNRIKIKKGSINFNCKPRVTSPKLRILSPLRSNVGVALK